LFWWDKRRKWWYWWFRRYEWRCKWRWVKFGRWFSDYSAADQSATE
jgi:hypothetical protein